MECRKILIALAVMFNGNWFDIFDHINKRDVIDEREIDTLCSRLKCGVITILDPEYPEYLKCTYRPPFVLFYKGDISLLNNISNHLGVVGTREPSPNYASIANKIVTNLRNDLVIVSGLASGIDAIAHTAALASGKKTIAVVGNGINICFPTENASLYRQIAEKGLLISEYPPGCRPSKEKFPLRNRLIAFFSKAVFVPQAFKRSGSLITAGYALDAGKDVLCMPSESFNNSACNILIKDGANLVENEHDIEDFFV